MNLEDLINSGTRENKTGAYDYKGYKIIFIDLNGVQPDGIKNRVEPARKLIFAEPPGSVLLLTDFRDMRYDPERTAYAKQFSGDIKPFIKKSALLGIEGLKKIVLKSVILLTQRTNMKPFSDLKDALQWLIS